MRRIIECPSLPVILLMTCAVLLMIPLEDENRLPSVLGMSCSIIIAFLLFVLQVPVRSICAVIMLFAFLYLSTRTILRYRREFVFNSKKSRRFRIVCESRNFYSSLFFLCGLALVALHGIAADKFLAIPLAVLAVILSVRAITGRCMFIPVKMRLPEPEIIADMGWKEESLKSIYDRAISYIEEKKAYANSALLQPELAKMIGVSCRDLSRAISLYSEDNYRSIIKKLRVEYAADLMKRDPFMKVTEAGRMSGFQSESAFTSSFKEITGMTPSAYMRHERYRLKRSYPSIPFQE